MENANGHYWGLSCHVTNLNERQLPGRSAER